MDYKLKPPSALDYFTALVQSDDEFPLLETAISLAQDEFPSLDIQQVLSDMDHWTARLKRSILLYFLSVASVTSFRTTSP